MKYVCKEKWKYFQTLSQRQIKTKYFHFITIIAKNVTFPLKAQIFTTKPITCKLYEVLELLLPFRKCSQRCQHQSLEKYFSVVMWFRFNNLSTLVILLQNKFLLWNIVLYFPNCEGGKNLRYWLSIFCNPVLPTFLLMPFAICYVLIINFKVALVNLCESYIVYIHGF